MTEWESPSTTMLACFTQPLIRWYGKNGRDLPWRETSDPYAIWVSEVMLQQTQVSTVIPYYHRFLSAFPTLSDLAASRLNKVLKLWEGLGYYARARHLHEAARVLVEQFNGRFPSTLESVRALPGIGRSTAGAILNIALDQRHPILDGNVKRVLCRYFCLRKDPGSREGEAALWRYAEALLPMKKTGVFTQAIMDLGATCCTPRLPQCSICPVRSGCEGYRSGLQASLPIKKKSKPIPTRNYVVGMILFGDSVLIRKRPPSGLFGGLWEFPTEEMPRQGDAGRLLGEKLAPLLKQQGSLTTAQHSFDLRHTLTHFKMVLHFFVCGVNGPIKKVSLPLKWVPLAALKNFPFPAAYVKAADRLTNPEKYHRMPAEFSKLCGPS